MNAKRLGALGLALGLWSAGARGGDVVWRPVKAPAAALGRPVAVVAPPPPSFVVRAQAADPVPPIPPLAPPPSSPPVAPASPYTYTPPVAPPCPPGELYNQGAVPAGPPPGGPSMWDRTKDLFNLQSGPFCGNGNRKAFQSDHAFDGLVSPVTNPFLFEDPRALTELRPIFMYQTIPSDNYVFQGGDVEFFGVQGRLALTERWSVVLSKLGGVWVNPKNETNPGYEGGSGFGEVHVGPKWTFIRNERSGAVGALGVIFQIPTGSSKPFQDTGSLSVVPYLTFGQHFGRTSYGSFNALGTFGYALATDDKRSDSLFVSLHLDYDVANLHRIYPFLELNWTYFAGNGSARDLGFEGRDLINFGATNVTGNNNVSLAPGLRYKFNENVQFGTAVEFPVVGRKDIQDFRFTVDMIFRY